MVDYISGDATVIAVVEDMGTHVARAATLRIDRDGSIARQGYDPDGEEVWAYEYRVYH